MTNSGPILWGYYIKQVDLDGQVTYSAVKRILFSKDDKIVIYPNPTKDIVILKGLDKGQAVIIYSLLGQELYKAKIAANGQHKINVSHWAAASYQIVILSDGQIVKTFKFEKQ